MALYPACIVATRAVLPTLNYLLSRRCILQQFTKIGVGMLPSLDNYTNLESVSLQPLMEGVHTKEAIELVRSMCSKIRHTLSLLAVPHAIHTASDGKYMHPLRAGINL